MHCAKSKHARTLQRPETKTPNTVLSVGCYIQCQARSTSMTAGKNGGARRTKNGALNFGRTVTVQLQSYTFTDRLASSGGPEHIGVDVWVTESE